MQGVRAIRESRALGHGRRRELVGDLVIAPMVPRLSASEGHVGKKPSLALRLGCVLLSARPAFGNEGEGGEVVDFASGVNVGRVGLG